jgi:hypothetical protein
MSRAATSLGGFALAASAFAGTSWAVIALGRILGMICTFAASALLAAAAWLLWRAVAAWRCAVRHTVWVFEGRIGDLVSDPNRPTTQDWMEGGGLGSAFRLELWVPGNVVALLGVPTARRARPCRIAKGDCSFVGERALTRAERHELAGHVWATIVGWIWMPLAVAVIVLDGVVTRARPGSGPTWWDWLLAAALFVAALARLRRLTGLVRDLIGGKCVRHFGSDFVWLPTSKAAWFEKERPAPWRQRTAPWMAPPPSVWHRTG